MREVRLEELIDEAILPKIDKPNISIDKNNDRMETSNPTTKKKHDSTCSSVKSNYREDENIE